MRWCLGKSGEVADITTWGDGDNYVLLCIWCSGIRYERLERCDK